jgi:hypothetical protein
MHEQTILDYFSLLKEKGLLGTTYLFIGDNEALVRDIVKLSVCSQSRTFCGACWDCAATVAARHPDVFLIEPQPATIKIEQVREAQAFLALKSFRAPRKIIFMRNAQSLGLEAANAFLKTLEEPPRNSFLAIAASKSEGLLPTIVSRCRKIFLPAAGDAAAVAAPELLAAFIGGQKIKCRDRHEFSALVWTYCALLRDALFAKTSSRNIRLLKDPGYEIIERSLGRRFDSPQKLMAALEQALIVYGARAAVNENLALSILRA